MNWIDSFKRIRFTDLEKDDLILLINWHRAIRYFAALSLLFSAWVISSLSKNHFSILPILYIIIAVCVANYICKWFLKKERFLEPIILIFMLIDTSSLTVGIHFTGGSHSLFGYSYLIAILGAGLVSYPFGFLVATFSSFGSLLLYALEASHIIAPIFGPPVKHGLQTLLPVGMRIVFFYFCIIVSGYYSQNLIKKLNIVTKSKKTAERLSGELKEACEKLKSVDKMKDEFVSMVSHEFRTPLTSIKAFTEILISDPNIEVNKQTEFLDIIAKESDRLTRLVTDVLDLSKIASGKFEWHIEKIDLAEIIQSSIASLKALAEKKGISVETELDGGLPAIKGNTDRLIQVMANLLKNAIEFTSEKGKIVIKAKSDNGQAEVSVEDNGMGIAPENLERVFERFVQLGEREHGKPRGTGLGLPITREIIEHHGGKIWAESEGLGRGSAFRFTLPIAGERQDG